MTPLKKTTIGIALLFGLLSAQTHVQLHYDKERGHYTSTIEMFSTDDLGSNFFFVDFDYEEGRPTSAAYWEIAKMFNIEKTGFGIQYNGGLNTYGSFEPSWLIGMEYPVNLGIIEVMSSGWLRHTDLYGWGFQYTAVWFKPLSDKISFTGFADVWNDGQTTVWMTEPQIWYSLGKLSVGGEVEISQNFVYGAGEDIQIMPTLGLKWEF
tara:strand:- start:2767 stop:3390 length:624 start_codon:yes stop_codon:yes gene_type:complete